MGRRKPEARLRVNPYGGVLRAIFGCNFVTDKFVPHAGGARGNVKSRSTRILQRSLDGLEGLLSFLEKRLPIKNIFFIKKMFVRAFLTHFIIGFTFTKRTLFSIYLPF